MKRMEKPPVVDETPSFALESIEDLRAQPMHEERWIWDGYECTPRRPPIRITLPLTPLDSPFGMRWIALDRKCVDNKGACS